MLTLQTRGEFMGLESNKIEMTRLVETENDKTMVDTTIQSHSIRGIFQGRKFKPLNDSGVRTFMGLLLAAGITAAISIPLIMNCANVDDIKEYNDDLLTERQICYLWRGLAIPVVTYTLTAICTVFSCVNFTPTNLKEIPGLGKDCCLALLDTVCPREQDQLDDAV